MRTSIKDLVRIIADTLPIAEPIYEFGSLQVATQEGFADLRPFFPGKEYIGCDTRQGPGVDRLLDLHNIDLPPESAATVLLLDTLEHVEFVREALQEVYRILKPNGILLATSVMNFPIHDHPRDYWRFTPEGFNSLLKPFTSVIVDATGDKQFPHSVVGIAFKGSAPAQQSINAFSIQFHNWKVRWSEPAGKSWKTFLKLLAPPILLSPYRSIGGLSL